MTKASDKRDERLEKMHEALVAKTATLTTSEGWTEYLTFLARFRQYSFNNTMLILIQCPAATHVASYKKWVEMGRQVRKGEKSLGIFAPMMRKRTESDGTERSYISGFRIVPVFDISQTEGDPVPQPITPVLLDGEAPVGMYAALALLVAEKGYTLEVGPSSHGENGYCSPGRKMIHVTEGLSDAQACKTLVHEVAHMLLHCEEDSLSVDAIHHRGVAEVEAESVAHIVLGALGFDTDAYTLPYVAGWSDGKPEVVAATADRVLKTVKEVLAKTEEFVPAASAA
jgi:antirestriction protein ArdC